MNPVSVLNGLVQSRKIIDLKFKEGRLGANRHINQFEMTATCFCSGQFFEGFGMGPRIRDAKNEAAERLIRRLEEGPLRGLSDPQIEFMKVMEENGTPASAVQRGFFYMMTKATQERTIELIKKHMPVRSLAGLDTGFHSHLEDLDSVREGTNFGLHPQRERKIELQSLNEMIEDSWEMFNDIIREKLSDLRCFRTIENHVVKFQLSTSEHFDYPCQFYLESEQVCVAIRVGRISSMDELIKKFGERQLAEFYKENFREKLVLVDILPHSSLSDIEHFFGIKNIFHRSIKLPSIYKEALELHVLQHVVKVYSRHGGIGPVDDDERTERFLRELDELNGTINFAQNFYFRDEE